MVEDAQALGDIYLFILLLFNLLFTDLKIIKISLLVQPILYSNSSLHAPPLSGAFHVTIYMYKTVCNMDANT